jgi:hypothetical protein
MNAVADILDPCCGSRMFWFDRGNPMAVYGDIRSEQSTLCDGRTLTVSPDVPMDFRQLPFADGAFKLVVFDPPHLKRAGASSWMRAKFGALEPETWEGDIRNGFSECFRVLSADGVLIFKWNETQIKVSKILALTDQKPLFGHPSGKRANTHWICFMKRDDARMGAKP